MALLLDIATGAAVIAALMFLLWPRRKACGGASAGCAEFRIPLEQLRESARRGCGRNTGGSAAR
jgi:hypothetical protein